MRKDLSHEFDPQETNAKRTYHGVSRYFHPFEVPTKADAGKAGWILTQLTWKPSPRSTGFDADENGQSRQAQNLIPMGLEVRYSAVVFEHKSSNPVHQPS